METQEIVMIKNFCKGNRKSIFSIPPMGVDFELPYAKFLFVLQMGITEYGFSYLESSSDENKKVYLNAEGKAAIIVLIDSGNRITELSRISQFNNLDDQLNDLENIMNQFVEKYGAPHEWVKLDSNITACAWNARNGNSLSIGFDRTSNEIVCKYLRIES